MSAHSVKFVEIKKGKGEFGRERISCKIYTRLHVRNFSCRVFKLVLSLSLSPAEVYSCKLWPSKSVLLTKSLHIYFPPHRLSSKVSDET